jgi:flagellar biosynthesis chaperone FliJ
MFILSIGYAHDSDKAFFQIIQKNNFVEVNAEFPWTLRNALLTYAPKLKETKDKKEFEKALFEYIKSSFIITDIDKNILELLSVNEIKSAGHSHQNTFVLVYEQGVPFQITNTIMFNINDNQENYHNITVNKKSFKYLTSKNKPEFNLIQQKKESHYWFIILIILFCTILVYIKTRDKTYNLYFVLYFIINRFSDL